ncbi:MAG: hypothetical protein V2A34_03390, partial [Lentisphaerota bacterium]
LYREAIAVLNLATPLGFRDARFIATLGGMYFMDGSFTEAQDIFAKHHARTFSVQEIENPSFRPRDPKDTRKYLFLKGNVVSVKTGYSFIQTEDYPNFFCPASKYEGLILRKGMGIVFQPAFSAKGPVALHPRLPQTPPLDT